MPPHDPYHIFISKLNILGVRYMVSGSVAVSIYGEPRLTHDVDIVLEITTGDMPRMVKAFPAEEFYLPPLDVMVMENKRASRGHFNIIHHGSGYKADIYPIGRDPLHQWAMQSVRNVEIGGLLISVAPAEYVIVRKLEFYREGGAEKHLRDIRTMLQMSGGIIDQSVLKEKVEDRGLERVWEEITHK